MKAGTGTSREGIPLIQNPELPCPLPAGTPHEHAYLTHLKPVLAYARSG